MAFSAKEAAQLIVAEVSDSPPSAAAATAAAIKPGDFCALWPKAKPILEVVSGLVVLIPGLGAVAAGVLKGLLKVGDQIAAEVCKK
jgi:uncharacterized membrane protein YjjB (DUF3815 family)